MPARSRIGVWIGIGSALLIVQILLAICFVRFSLPETDAAWQLYGVELLVVALGAAGALIANQVQRAVAVALLVIVVLTVIAITFVMFTQFQTTPAHP